MIAFLVVGLVCLLAVGFCLLVAGAFWQWRGLWRVALAIPAVMLASADAYATGQAVIKE
jgi:hypothetical protein